jgi:uncharacterized membrane protein
MKKSLIALNLYAISLVILRIQLTDSIFYGFMLWNLFLAFIPFFLSKQIHSKLSLWILFPIWLLFLPNAPYILTDIFHLKQGTEMPMWYDLLLILTFSFTGIVYFFASLKILYQKITKYYTKTVANTVIYLSIILSSFGIYLGRYLRWNSWEIIHKSNQMLSDIFTRICNPLEHPKTWGITIGYSILFGIVFRFIKNAKISFSGTIIKIGN